MVSRITAILKEDDAFRLDNNDWALSVILYKTSGSNVYGDSLNIVVACETEFMSLSKLYVSELVSKYSTC